MKRTPLLVLGLVFLGLLVTCLFYPACSGKMQIALIVELIFFIHFAMVKENRTLSEMSNINTPNESGLKEENKVEVESAKSDVQKVY